MIFGIVIYVASSFDWRRNSEIVLYVYINGDVHGDQCAIDHTVTELCEGAWQAQEKKHFLKH